MVIFCLNGCNAKQASESDCLNAESQTKKQRSIEEEMYQQHGNYAVFKSDYTLNNKQIWVVFLKNEEMAIFINSNNLHGGRVLLSLRYEYEIRDSKLRFYNGYEKTITKVLHYPETSAEIFCDEDGVTFTNMKQFGNRRDVHISATLTNETLDNGCLNFIKKYANE